MAIHFHSMYIIASTKRRDLIIICVLTSCCYRCTAVGLGLPEAKFQHTDLLPPSSRRRPTCRFDKCLLRALGGPQSVDLADETDVGLGGDAGMGIPRCELQRFSQVVDIPPDPCAKAPHIQEHISLPSLSLAPKQQLSEHETAYETPLRQMQAPTASAFAFLILEARIHPFHTPLTALSRRLPRKF